MSDDIPDDNEKRFFAPFFSELMAENFYSLSFNELTAENFYSLSFNELTAMNFSSLSFNELTAENFSSPSFYELMAENFSTKKQMDPCMSKIVSYTATETKFLLRTNTNQESEFKSLIEPKINLNNSKQNKHFRVLKSLFGDQIITTVVAGTILFIIQNITTAVGNIVLFVIQKIFP